MTILEAVIQGVIQGATEFLPVSSSGHLSISQHIFGIELPGILFDIMLHLGTLVAVVFVYRGLIWRLIKEFFSLLGDVFRGRFKWADMSPDRRLIFMLIIGLLPLFLLFLPIPGTDMKIKDLKGWRCWPPARCCSWAFGQESAVPQAPPRAGTGQKVPAAAGRS